MHPLDFLKLIMLSAIWGASFLFVRVAVPEFGPILLIWIRVTGGAMALAPFLFRREHLIRLRGSLGKLALLGLFNSALPFTLFAVALLSLDAGFTSILNASTPIFAALLGLVWLKIPIRPAQTAGLFLGVLGVIILVGDQLTFEAGGRGWPVVATLAASLCYGFSTHFTKRHLAGVPTIVIAVGNLVAASLILLPFAILSLPSEVPSSSAIWCAVALSLLSTAVAFLFVFDLLSRCGATATTTVTFIIPIFGVLFGAVFLDEMVTIRMIVGMAVALLGAGLVSRYARRGPQ